MMQQPQKKKKKYKLQKEQPVNFKKIFLIIVPISVLVAMIVVSGLIDVIPGGPTFKLTVQQAPYSMLFILGFSFMINICSTVLGKALIDTGELQRKTRLIKEHNKEKQDVEKLKDENPKLYQKRMIKVKRREASIKKMTQSISMQRMKPSCMTMLPMIILFFFIRIMFEVPTTIAMEGGFFFDVTMGGNVGVAKMVMNPYPELNFLAAYLFPTPDLAYWGSQGFIGFTAFYFLCSFSVGAIVQRMAGLNTGGMGGMGGMPGFGGMK